jgi:hypothetical protein
MLSTPSSLFHFFHINKRIVREARWEMDRAPGKKALDEKGSRDHDALAMVGSSTYRLPFRDALKSGRGESTGGRKECDPDGA